MKPRTTHRGRRAGLACALVASIALPSIASATCIRAVPNAHQSPWSGVVTVKQNGVVGDVIAASDFDGRQVSALLCNVNQNADFSGGYALPPGWTYNAADKTLQTNLAGVKFRMTSNSPVLTNGTERQLGYTTRRLVTAADGNSAPPRVQLFDTARYRLELIRTAPSIAVGSFNNGRFAYFYSDNVTSTPYREMSTNGLALRAAACSIRAGDLNQTVRLGTHQAGDIVRDGQTSWVDFSFTSEDCDHSQLRNAQYTFTATADSRNGDLFRVTNPGGSAMNVGLELQAVPASGAVAVKPNTPLNVPTLQNNAPYAFRARLRSLTGVRPAPGAIRTAVQVNVDFM